MCSRAVEISYNIYNIYNSYNISFVNISLSVQSNPSNATYFGNSLWHVLSSWWQQLLGNPMAFGTKMEQWSVTLLPIGKPRAADNMTSMFWGWHFKSSACVCEAVIENDATKIYAMLTISKMPKWTELTIVKLPLSTWTLPCLNSFRVGGKEFIKMQLLPRVFGLWRGKLLWKIRIIWRGLRTTVWRALSYFVEITQLQLSGT